MMAQIPALPPTITVPEAMTRYGASAQLIRSERKSGAIAWTKRGREIVLFLDSADMWHCRRFVKETNKRRIK